jgi:hypothetical protein
VSSLHRWAEVSRDVLLNPSARVVQIASVCAYTAPRPAVLLVSSAGSERNAKVETEAERKAEIPIVQLNPGGILNWKVRRLHAVNRSHSLGVSRSGGRALMSAYRDA